MHDRELYRQILGIESPWKVERVELRRAGGEVHVFLEHNEQVRWPCPKSSPRLFFNAMCSAINYFSYTARF